METEPYSRAVRVDGEVLVLHCWACGTAHCVNLDLCVSGELTHMVCSNAKCRMSMFLVNELIVENDTRKAMTNTTLITPFAVLARYWR